MNKAEEELRNKLAWVEDVYSPDWDCYEQFGRVKNDKTPLDQIRERAGHTIPFEDEYCVSYEGVVANEIMSDRLVLLYLIDDIIQTVGMWDEQGKNYGKEILWRLGQ